MDITVSIKRAGTEFTEHKKYAHPMAMTLPHFYRSLSLVIELRRDFTIDR